MRQILVLTVLSNSIYREHARHRTGCTRKVRSRVIITKTAFLRGRRYPVDCMRSNFHQVPRRHVVFLLLLPLDRSHMPQGSMLLKLRQENEQQRKERSEPDSAPHLCQLKRNPPWLAGHHGAGPSVGYTQAALCYAVAAAWSLAICTTCCLRFPQVLALDVRH